MEEFGQAAPGVFFEDGLKVARAQKSFLGDLVDVQVFERGFFEQVDDHLPVVESVRFGQFLALRGVTAEEFDAKHRKVVAQHLLRAGLPFVVFAQHVFEQKAEFVFVGVQFDVLRRDGLQFGNVREGSQAHDIPRVFAECVRRDGAGQEKAVDPGKVGGDGSVVVLVVPGNKKYVSLFDGVVPAVEDVFAHAFVDVGDLQIVVVVLHQRIGHEYGLRHDDAFAFVKKVAYIIMIHDSLRTALFRSRPYTAIPII